MPSKTPISEHLEVKKILRLYAKQPKSLRDYFDIGDCMLKLAERPEAASSKGLRQAVAEVTGMSLPSLSKCCQFRTKYTQKLLTEVEDLGVGWGLLTVSFCITDSSKRHRLLQKAMSKEWNGADLRLAVRAKTKTSRGGGRPRRTIKSYGLFADLDEIGRLAERFKAYCKMWDGQSAEYRREIRALPDDDGKLLQEKIAAVEKLLRSQEHESKELLMSLKEFRQMKA